MLGALAGSPITDHANPDRSTRPNISLTPDVVTTPSRTQRSDESNHSTTRLYSESARSRASRPESIAAAEVFNALDTFVSFLVAVTGIRRRSPVAGAIAQASCST